MLYLKNQLSRRAKVSGMAEWYGEDGKEQPKLHLPFFQMSQKEISTGMASLSTKKILLKLLLQLQQKTSCYPPLAFLFFISYFSTFNQLALRVLTRYNLVSQCCDLVSRLCHANICILSSSVVSMPEIDTTSRVGS